MRRLTTKQHIGISMAFYFFVFLAAVATIFFFVFRSVLIFQIKKDMSDEITRTFADYVAVHEGSIVFTSDESGNDLREELIKSGFSGLFLDADLNPIRGFGLFGIYSGQDKDKVLEIVHISNEVVNSKKIHDETLMWQGQEIYAYFVPIIFEDEVKGVGILGKNIKEIDTVTNVLVLTFVSFGFFAVLASFLLGKALVSKFFAPVSEFTKLVEKTDLDDLGKSVTIEGNPNDELVVLAHKFNEMLSRLKEASLQEKEFISNVSHELKTPITKAISSIEVFSLSPAVTQEHFEEVKKDLLEINTLIDKLLFLSRLQKHTVKKDETTNLLDVIKDVYQKFYDELGDKGINFKVDLTDGLIINMPKEYASVLFSNLLSNAIKYSDKKANINISAKKETNKVCVSIEDTGIGMTAEEMHKAFDRFYRSSEGKRYGAGSGIGLSIVKRICELYDVKINIKSGKGEGTKFSLLFN